MSLTFIITPAYVEGRQLTRIQRTSPHFATEPQLLGRVLRRGQKMEITEEQLKTFLGRIVQLVKAEAIHIATTSQEGAEFLTRNLAGTILADIAREALSKESTALPAVPVEESLDIQPVAVAEPVEAEATVVVPMDGGELTPEILISAAEAIVDNALSVPEIEPAPMPESTVGRKTKKGRKE